MYVSNRFQSTGRLFYPRVVNRALEGEERSGNISLGKEDPLHGKGGARTV
jgi:hypothetical protein